MDRHAAWAALHARLDDKAEPVAFDLPSLVVGKPLVRQGGLAPSRIQEPDAVVLVAHVG